VQALLARAGEARTTSGNILLIATNIETAINNPCLYAGRPTGRPYNLS